MIRLDISAAASGLAQVLHGFLHQSVAAFYVLQDDAIVYASPGVRAIFGYEPEEFVGLGVERIVHADDLQAMRAAIARRLLDESEASVLSFRAMRRDGRATALRVHASVVEYNGAPAMAGVAFDVNDEFESRQRLEEAERRLRLVFESVRDVVFQTDREGRWALLNPAWEALTGHAVAECLGKPFHDFIHDADRAANVRGFERLLRGEKPFARAEVRYRTKGGGYRWLGIHARTVTNERGEVVGTSGVLRDITARRATELKLKETSQRLEEITSVIADGVYVVDPQGRFEFVNPAAEAILGWAQEDLLGLRVHDTIHRASPDGPPRAAEDCPAVRAQREGTTFRSHAEEFLRKDGGFVAVAHSLAPIVRDGAVCGAVGAFHDISEQIAAEQALRDSEERFRVLFNSGMDSIGVTNVGPDGRLTRYTEVNDVMCQRLGYSREELLALTPYDVTAPDSLPDFETAVEQLLRDGSALFERALLDKGGRRIPVEVNANLFTFHGEPTVVSVARDITERKRAEELINHMALHDALTDLPNRRLMTDRLDRAIALARRHERRTAVLLLDLDGFKPINDTHGHDVGDEVLKTVADRLRRSLRHSDSACRLGGDEFVAVLKEINAVDDALIVARKLVAVVNEPIRVHGLELRVGTSVGVACYPEHGGDTAALMRAADQAMYRAKAGGKNHACFAQDPCSETP